jgi:hypothetical protein
MKLRVIRFAAIGQDNGSYMEGDLFEFVIEIDGTGRAQLFTVPAFALGQVEALIRINGIFQRDGLSILHIDGFAVAQRAVIIIYHLFGAFVRTKPAGNTFLGIHITGILLYRYLEVALFTGYVLDFRQCQ